MSIELDDAIGADVPTGQVNEFGGDVLESFESNSDSRGDFVASDDYDDELVVDTKAEADEAEQAEADEAEPIEEAEADEESSDAESDEADDGEDDGEAEADDGSDGKQAPKNDIPTTVPRHRLNKEVEKRKKAEAQYRELLASTSNADASSDNDVSASPDVEIDSDSFTKMQSALLDGETDTAQGLFKDMLSSVAATAVKMAEKRATDKVMGDLKLQEQTRELSTVATEVFESYPEFDHNSDDADETLIAEVIELRDFYAGKMPAGEALRKAAKQIATENEVKDRTYVEPKAEAKKPAKKNDIRRKIELAGREQGRLTGSSANNKQEALKALDISRMTDEQFGQLSEADKARARGDIL